MNYSKDSQVQFQLYQKAKSLAVVNTATESRSHGGLIPQHKNIVDAEQKSIVSTASLESRLWFNFAAAFLQ
jgi:hypothetical protein